MTTIYKIDPTGDPSTWERNPGGVLWVPKGMSSFSSYVTDWLDKLGVKEAPYTHKITPDFSHLAGSTVGDVGWKSPGFHVHLGAIDDVPKPPGMQSGLMGKLYQQTKAAVTGPNFPAPGEYRTPKIKTVTDTAAARELNALALATAPINVKRKGKP